MPEGLTQLAFELGASAFARTVMGSASVDDPARLQSVMATLSVRHHFGRGLAAGLRLPVGLVRYDAGPGVRAGYITGFGDLRVGGRYDLAALWGARGRRPSLAIAVDVALPTGKQQTIGEEGGPFPPSVLAVGRGAFAVAARLTGPGAPDRFRPWRALRPRRPGRPAGAPLRRGRCRRNPCCPGSAAGIRHRW